jgi:hypothetical protein
MMIGTKKWTKQSTTVAKKILKIAFCHRDNGMGKGTKRCHIRMNKHNTAKLINLQ